MSFSITLTDKESFDNYTAYKDDIENKLYSNMDRDDLESFDLAVVKELYTMNFINYEFYVKQCENIKTIHKYRNSQSSYNITLICLLKILLLISFIISVILILYKYKSMDRFEL